MDLPGEVSEWLMVADSKSVLGLHLTEVRILSSPYLMTNVIIKIAAMVANRPLIYVKGSIEDTRDILQWC